MKEKYFVFALRNKMHCGLQYCLLDMGANLGKKVKPNCTPPGEFLAQFIRPPHIIVGWTTNKACVRVVSVT